MATVEKLITDAYYISGIKARQANEVLNAVELITGTEILTEILDALSLDASFASFLTTLQIISPQETIFIGRNLTPDPEILIIDDSPFKSIFGARITESSSNSYPLQIKALSDYDQISTQDVTGLPKYFFYGTKLQNNNIFNEIRLYPFPSQPLFLNLNGIQIQEAYTADPTIENIRATFTNCLKYMVARELACEYGTMEIWAKKRGDQTLMYYRDLIANAAPADYSPNDLSHLLEGNYNNEYPWY